MLNLSLGSFTSMKLYFCTNSMIHKVLLADTMAYFGMLCSVSWRIKEGGAGLKYFKVLYLRHRKKIQQTALPLTHLLFTGSLIRNGLNVSWLSRSHSLKGEKAGVCQIMQELDWKSATGLMKWWFAAVWGHVDKEWIKRKWTFKEKLWSEAWRTVSENYLKKWKERLPTRVQAVLKVP